MTLIIGIACFVIGAWFGIAAMCIFTVAKQADEEIEKQEDYHGR